ncbi:MAG: S-adenosyl-methyltransferase MraW [Pseudomonadota bacterium]|jgi:16S rRNA (cytosine1402-N4)-methyltransferase
MKMSEYTHQPVLCVEAIAALNIRPDGHYIDATFGRGGHSRAILSHLSPQGRLLVIDQDPSAIEVANIMATQDTRLSVCHARFDALESHCMAEDILGKVDGVLLDLGVSSPQLDTPERGFSFMQAGPLDMRMNPTTGQSAAAWIASATESEIADVFYRYGEERFSRRLSKAIVEARSTAPIETTDRLADIIKRAHPAWEKHKHPATRCFQAIRIFINEELSALENALAQTLSVLAPHGRLAVISFHSLEDRIVKQFMQRQAKPPLASRALRRLPTLQEEVAFTPRLRIIGKKIRPTAVEVQENPRARSALLRVAERTEIR